MVSKSLVRNVKRKRTAPRTMVQSSQPKEMLYWILARNRKPTPMHGKAIAKPMAIDVRYDLSS